MAGSHNICSSRIIVIFENNRTLYLKFFIIVDNAVQRNHSILKN